MMSTMTDSIYTKIINGEIPAHRVYEDDECIGILDIYPITPGHTLVIPKKQIEQFTQMTSKEFAQLTATAHKVAQHIQKTLGCQRIVMRIEGFDVPHTHIHLVPVNHEHESYKPNRELTEPNHAELGEMAQQLRMTPVMS